VKGGETREERRGNKGLRGKKGKGRRLKVKEIQGKQHFHNRHISSMEENTRGRNVKEDPN
jgi:hypothetical protein